MSLTLLLRCRGTDQTRDFYESVLGFAVADSAEKTITAQRWGAKLIFTERDLWNGPPGCTGTLYFSVPDIEGFFASVRCKVSVAWPLQDTLYGSREFGITDCNGYVLAFQGV